MRWPVLRLLTEAGPLTIDVPAGVDQGEMSPVSRLNALITGETIEPLILRQGGDFQALPYGLAGSIMAASGLVLAVVAYRIITRPTHVNLVGDVAISPDGQTVASASWDQTIQLWRTADHLLDRALVGHNGAVSTIEFTPDGAMLASAGWDHAVRAVAGR